MKYIVRLTRASRWVNCRYKSMPRSMLISSQSLGVYTMKCVGYDNAFQLEICEKFASYIPPPPKARKAANATKPPGQKQNKAPATSKIRGKKRKRQSSKNDHDSDNTDGEREWA